MRSVTVVLFSVLACQLVWAEPCQEALAAIEAPVRLKARGKPKRAHWQTVDKVLVQASERLEGLDCTVTFEQLFDVRDDDPLFPLTNNVLRLVPETTLMDLQVVDHDGAALGSFAGRSRFERSGGLYASRSYSLYFFQYRAADGDLRSSGHDLLLDRFLVAWADLKDKPILAPTSGVSR